MSLNITIGSESTGRVLIPVVDGVKARLTDIKENRFSNERLDFAFTIIDMDYEGGDDEDNEFIQGLAQDGYVHYETVNLPEPGKKLGKTTKFYKLLKGMSGGKDIEEGTSIELEDYLAKDYLLDFDHVEKKGGPPDFAVVPGVFKSQVSKIRPVRKAKATRQAPLVEVVDDEDDDLLNDD